MASETSFVIDLVVSSELIHQVNSLFTRFTLLCSTCKTCHFSFFWNKQKTKQKVVLRCWVYSNFHQHSPQKLMQQRFLYNHLFLFLSLSPLFLILRGFEWFYRSAISGLVVVVYNVYRVACSSLLPLVAAACRLSTRGAFMEYHVMYDIVYTHSVRLLLSHFLF